MNIWALLTIFVIIIGYLVYYHFTGSSDRLFTLYSLFSFMWMVILILSLLRLYGIYEASSHFYFLIFLGIASWILGYFTLRYTKTHNYSIQFHTARRNRVPKDKSASHNECEKKYVVNKPIFIAFELVVFIFIIMIGLRTFSLTQRGYSLEQIRNVFLSRGEEDFFESSTVNTVYSKLMVPCIYALMPASIILLFEKGNLWLSVIALAEAISYEFVTGGRFYLLYIAVDVVLAFGLYNVKLSKKVKRRLILSVIALFVGIIVITVVRRRLYITGDYMDLFDTYYTYVTLSIPLGDYWISYIDSHNLITYGVATFRGILANINFILNRIGIGLFNEILSEVNDIIAMTEDNYIRIATSHSANAYVTWIYYFYLDFREFGVVIGSYVFGAIAGFFEKYSIKKKTILTYAYYLLFAQSVVKCFVRWEFSIAAYILAFIYIRFLFKKDKCTDYDM